MFDRIRGRAHSFVERHDLDHRDAAVFGGAALTSVMSIGLGLVLVGTATTTTIASPPGQTRVVKPHVTVLLPNSKATPTPAPSPQPQSAQAGPTPQRVIIVSQQRPAPQASHNSVPSHRPSSRPSHSPSHSPSPQPSETCNSVPLTTVKVCHG